MTAPGPYRLPVGGHVDRAVRLGFSFDGRACYGHPGDTLASALLANGIRVVGRSFKYHRPRGLVTAGADEPNAIVQLTGSEDEPNVRATTLPLHDGLSARSVNCWPSPRCDLGAVNGALAPLLPAGFYYKTLMGGLGWNVYGRLIRRLAGLGTAPRTAPTHRYEKRFHHCDLLVVGAGPSGLAAALRGARAGARVLLVDDAPQPGGELLDAPARVNGAPAAAWVAAVTAELDACPTVLRLTNTTACGYYDHNFLVLLQREPTEPWLHERLWKVRARRVILACGAMERPLVFPDNDRPGVMQLHAVRRYARRYGVMSGRRAVVLANHSGALDAAADLVDLGLQIAAIVDVRADREAASPYPPALADIEVLHGHTITRVVGRGGVRAVQVAPRSRPDAESRIDCDLVAMSGGWDPLVHLASQTGE